MRIDHKKNISHTYDSNDKCVSVQKHHQNKRMKDKHLTYTAIINNGREHLYVYTYRKHKTHKIHVMYHQWMEDVT